MSILDNVIIQCATCYYWKSPASHRFVDRKRGCCSVKLPPYISVPDDRTTNWYDTCDLFKYNEEIIKLQRGLNTLGVF